MPILGTKEVRVCNVCIMYGGGESEDQKGHLGRGDRAKMRRATPAGKTA